MAGIHENKTGDFTRVFGCENPWIRRRYLPDENVWWGYTGASQQLMQVIRDCWVLPPSTVGSSIVTPSHSII